MLILFDIDDTLLNHKAAERYAATLLYKSVNLPMSLDEFLLKWADALEHHFARYLAGEVS
jgi:putative hydrolase of the HAD superfamily